MVHMNYIFYWVDRYVNRTDFFLKKYYNNSIYDTTYPNERCIINA